MSERRTGGDPSPVPGSADGLQAIGLDAAEEAAYELLLDVPNGTAAELSPAWDRPEHLNAVLARLQAKGLLRLLPGPPARYVVAPPQIALEALALEQERQLRAARSHAERLAELYRDRGARTGAESPVEVVTGRPALGQRLAQLTSGAQHEVRCLEMVPPAVDQAAGLLDPDLVPDGVGCRTVYDRAFVEEPRTVPGVEGLVRAGQQARILPDLPMSTLLVDDVVAVLPLWTEPTAIEAAVVVHPCALFDALSDLFEGLWQRAIPLDLPSLRPEHAADRSEQADQRVTALMLTGLTEQAIARRLGLGHRTVQRRIAVLIAELGARTRFQAGVQAAFRDGVGPAAADRPIACADD